MTPADKKVVSNLNAEYFSSGDWILSLDEVEQWLGSFQDQSDNLALGFCSLKRSLTETDDAEIRSRSITLCNQFLDELEAWLKESSVSRDNIKISFGILMTILGEVGPYRYETKRNKTDDIRSNILSPMESIRKRAVDVAITLFNRTEFDLIRASIDEEIAPLINSVLEEHDEEHGRFMPFRIVQISKIANRLLELAVWLGEESVSLANASLEELIDLLKDCYDLKYPKFGTSGLRGLWNEDFTETKACRTVQAVCQFLRANQVPEYVSSSPKSKEGKWLIIGYDGRRNSRKVANWLAGVALANNFPVLMANRPTPTPALAFYGTHHIGKDEISGIVNCTASHNPSEWQGIKFNPSEGFPASTHITNIIAARTNEMQLLNVEVAKSSLDKAESDGDFKHFDALPAYWDWIKSNGDGNMRIRLDLEKIENYYSDKLVIIDEMHGAGRGYMSHIFGELGIKHKVIHAERDIDLGDLDYANPEPPFIQPLIDTVIAENAAVGLGLDTDADRFGIVDVGGNYFRPNQILAMLANFLCNHRELEGRVVITQTGLPLIDKLIQNAPGLDGHRPGDNVLPPYVDHPFYKRRLGERDDMAWENVFVVPVGIKYIVEIPRMNNNYQVVDEDKLETNWMDKLLLGGEESSGLTTRGHVPDKDGMWANLLIMDMIAYYGKPLKDIWEEMTAQQPLWESFGERLDIDASDKAKEQLINYYLDLFKDKKPGEVTMGGFPVLYAGGIRYDMVEIFIGNKKGEMRNFLRIRASGTEPINRIYAETEDPDLWETLQREVLAKLDEFTVHEIKNAYRIENLVDILTVTKPDTKNVEVLSSAIVEKLTLEEWSHLDLVNALRAKQRHIEKRNRDIVEEWLANLVDG